jgi:hypothetical protein
MIAIFIGVQEHGGLIVTELEAVADDEATQHEKDFVDKVAASFGQLIAEAGGSGTVQINENAIDLPKNGRKLAP